MISMIFGLVVLHEKISPVNACGVVIVALTGLNPVEVYAGIIDGAVGSSRRLWVTSSPSMEGEVALTMRLLSHPAVFSIRLRRFSQYPVFFAI